MCIYIFITQITTNIFVCNAPKRSVCIIGLTTDLENIAKLILVIMATKEENEDQRINNFVEKLILYEEPSMQFILSDELKSFIKDILVEFNNLSDSEKNQYRKELSDIAHTQDSKLNRKLNGLLLSKSLNSKNCVPLEKDKIEEYSEIHLAWLSRLAKDAIYCFVNNVKKVDYGHTYHFNFVLDKTEKIDS